MDGSGGEAHKIPSLRYLTTYTEERYSHLSLSAYLILFISHKNTDPIRIIAQK